MRANVVVAERTEPAPLTVRLLGELEVRRGTELLPLPASRRTRALLGYLVATASSHSRSALCDLLWEGPEDPRASLRWSLTKLRDVVDDPQAPRLIADRERVAFQALECEVDVAQVQALLGAPGDVATASLSALEALAACFRGDFLEGLELPTCYRFHHWCLAERERYAATRRRVLAAITDRLSGEPEKALPFGRALLVADPLAESSHAVMVGLLAAVGRYPEAEQHYDWARGLLRREIEIAAGGPLDEAIRLARRGRRDTVGKAAPPPAETERPGTRNAHRRPLVGRGVERRAILEAFDTPGRARLLLFTGEPGMGKTRLLDEFAAQALATGHHLLRGRCFEAEAVRPYGLWLDVLRGLTRDGAAPEVVAQAEPLLAGQASADGGRDRLFDTASALLCSLALRRPVAIALDDLQWIDEGSAALLHFLARTAGDGPPLLFGAAARAGELHDNASARSLLQSLAREGGVRTFALESLTPAEAVTLVGTAPVDAQWAWQQTGGNPLYLSELVEAARRGEATAGQVLDTLIQARLQSLDDLSHELLAWSSAARRELHAELLSGASGLPVAEVLSRLQRLERHGLMTPTRQGRFDFAHDVVRQAVYGLMSQPHRQAIHRRFARALDAAAADDPGLHGEVVHHAELAGDTLAAAQACLAAGGFCLRMFANEQAAAFAERGLGHLDTAMPSGAQRVHLEIDFLRLRVAAAAVPGGRRLPPISERIERAIAAAEALGLHAQAASGWEILAFWRQQASDSERTREATLAAERMTRRADATTRCLQLANSGRCLLDIEADPVRGRALLEEAAVLADELGLKVMEIEWGRGLAARADGDLDAAREALMQAIELAHLAENHWREFECMVWLAMVEFEQGRHEDVLKHAAEIVAAAARMGEPQAPFAQALAALAACRMGNQGAADRLTATLEELRERDDKAHLAWILNESALLALDEGRPGESAAHAAEALAAARAVRRPTEALVAAAILARARARVGMQETVCAEAGGPPQWPLSSAPSARAAGAIALAAHPLPTLDPTPRP